MLPSRFVVPLPLPPLATYLTVTVTGEDHVVPERRELRVSAREVGSVDE